MKRKIVWILANGCLAGSLLYGFEFEHQGFKNIGLFLVWFASIIVVIAALSEKISAEAQAKGYTFNAYVNYCYDIVVLMILIYYGAIFSAIVWGQHIFFQIHIYEVTKKRQYENEMPKM
jgi:hypothetical protein